MEDLEERAVVDFGQRCHDGDIRTTTHPMYAYSFGHQDGATAMRHIRKSYFMLGALVGVAFTLTTIKTIDHYFKPEPSEQKKPHVDIHTFQPKNYATDSLIIR